MYLQLQEPDKECSMCGAVNQIETVSRRHGLGDTVHTFIRCIRCGHEKEIYSMTTSSTGGPVSYTMKPTDNKEVF